MARDLNRNKNTETVLFQEKKTVREKSVLPSRVHAGIARSPLLLQSLQKQGALAVEVIKHYLQEIVLPFLHLKVRPLPSSD
jgi:hypothetical protein